MCIICIFYYNFPIFCQVILFFKTDPPIFVFEEMYIEIRYRNTKYSYRYTIYLLFIMQRLKLI